MVSLDEMRRAWLAVAALLGGPMVAACGADGYDTSQLPEGLRSDYAVFARRCSRCHGLSRPLSANVDDDAFWKRYVEQMRLKPGSGISVADEAPILRFLHYYMLQRRHHDADADAPPPASTDGAAPTGSAGAL